MNKGEHNKLKSKFAKRNYLILMVICSFALCIGAALILVNTRAVCLKSPEAAIDKDLTYNGAYIDLLGLERQSASLDINEVRVTRVDNRTGFPAPANITIIDEGGEEIAQINVVGFTYQGRPAVLRFLNNAVTGFTYQGLISDWVSNRRMWETDPDFLRDALKDYSSQVAALLS